MKVISGKKGIRNYLKKQCEEYGSVAKWARKHKFGRSFITEVISGKYDPTKSERLMKALKLEETRIWYPEGEKKPTLKEIKGYLEEKAAEKKRLGKMADWKYEEF